MIFMSDVIKLDNHRLLCGNAQVKEDVDKLLDGVQVDLLLTDPPYGINIVQTVKIGEREREQMVGLDFPGEAEAREYKPIINDDKPFNPQHLLNFNVPSILFGANNFAHELPNNSKWLVWFKKADLNKCKNPFSDCELAWTNFDGKSVKLYHHTWSGMIRQGERRLELKERVHPTQKPVGLLKRLIEEYCPPNGVVLDLYGGSCSTLIACAETGRTCYMMELSKDYVNIIQERYWNYIDKDQTKLM